MRRKRLWSVENDNNKDIVLKGLKKYGNLLYFVGETLRKDLEVVIEGIKRYGASLEYVGDEFRNNRDLVKMAVRNNGISLQYASDRLRDDDEIVLYSVRNRGDSLEFASERLERVVKAAIEKSSLSLEFASQTLKDDRQLVSLAISQTSNSEIISFASDRLKNDEEIVIQAFLKNQESFAHAGPNIKSSPKIFELIFSKIKVHRVKNLFSGVSSPSVINEEFFLKYIPQNGYLLEILPDYNLEHLCDRKDVALGAVRSDGISLKFVSDRLREDEEVVYEAIGKYFHSAENASPKLLDDRKFVLSIITKISGEIIRYVSPRLKDDFDLVREGIISHPDAWCWASERLRGDESLFRLVLKIAPDKAIKLAGPGILRQRSLVLEATRADPLKTFQALSVSRITVMKGEITVIDRLLDDRELVMEAISRHIPEKNSASFYCHPLMYASSRLRGDEEVVMLAVKNDPDCRSNVLGVTQYPLSFNFQFYRKVVNMNYKYFFSFVRRYPSWSSRKKKESNSLFLEALVQNVDYCLENLLLEIMKDLKDSKKQEKLGRRRRRGTNWISIITSSLFSLSEDNEFLSDFYKIVFEQASGGSSIKLLTELYRKVIKERFLGDQGWGKFYPFLKIRNERSIALKIWKEDFETRKLFLLNEVDDDVGKVKLVFSNEKVVLLKKVFFCV